MKAFRGFDIHIDLQITAYLFENFIFDEKAENRAFLGAFVAYLCLTESHPGNPEDYDKLKLSTTIIAQQTENCCSIIFLDHNIGLTCV